MYLMLYLLIFLTAGQSISQTSDVLTGAEPMDSIQNSSTNNVAALNNQHWYPTINGNSETQTLGFMSELQHANNDNEPVSLSKYNLFLYSYMVFCIFSFF